MPRVDFYLLPGESALERLRLVCRLTDKAYHLGHRVFILAESPAEMQQLDDLLWTFTPGSFLPHAIGTPAATEDPPILIGQDAGAADAHVLINLGPELPAMVERFERIIEVVDGGEEARRLARERYRQYRDRGCALETHTLGQVP